MWTKLQEREVWGLLWPSANVFTAKVKKTGKIFIR